MKKIFDSICVKLMLINNNVYTFISGILLSLATGMITTLCFEKAEFLSSWHLYLSSIIYTIVGGIFIYVESQITTYQNYIKTKQIIDKTKQHSIIRDFESHRYVFWVLLYLILVIALISGTVLLFLNYAK